VRLWRTWRIEGRVEEASADADGASAGGASSGGGGDTANVSGDVGGEPDAILLVVLVGLLPTLSTVVLLVLVRTLGAAPPPLVVVVAVAVELVVVPEPCCERPECDDGNVGDARRPELPVCNRPPSASADASSDSCLCDVRTLEGTKKSDIFIIVRRSAFVVLRK
jgi:hypothetical protein